MASDTQRGNDGACVYVAQALLDTLERDKRTLKWQLARASRAADDHAAKLAACEAQVKDLMTIVEMNKSVAHKAVQRSYTKECVLQRLHQERVVLQTRVETQRRRGVELLQRRVAQRRQRQALHAWASEAMQRRLRRVAVRRVLRSRRRRWLQQGFHEWQRRVRLVTSSVKMDASAVVYPVSSHSVAYTVPEKAQHPVHRPAVRFALSPTSSTSSVSTEVLSGTFHHADSSRKSLSFATWKSQWLAQKRRYTTAIHFARLMLVKRVLTEWKHVVRRRNWREAMVASAIQRRRYHCFGAWASWTKRRRITRAMLAKVVRQAVRRFLHDAFVALRVKCLEKCLTDWGGIIKDAQEAIEEERKLYSLQQGEAMSEIDKRASEQHLRQTQFQEMQLKALQKKHTVGVLTKCMTLWQRQTAFRNMQRRVADQFHRHRKRRRLTHQVFSKWKARTRHLREVKRFRERRSSFGDKIRLATAFRGFVRVTQRLIAQKQALKRVVQRRKMMASSRAFWKWRGSIALSDEQANAHLEQRQLVNRFEIRESASHSESLRLRRIGYKYQLKCALIMGDMSSEKRKRRLFTLWKGKTLLIHKRKTALKKVLSFKLNRLQAMAFDNWRYQHVTFKLLEVAQQENVRRRAHRTLRTAFIAWRTSSQKQITSSTRSSLQFVAFMLWRHRSSHQRVRRAMLSMLVKFRLRYCWIKPAFDTWKRKVEVAQVTARRQREYRHELLRFTLQRWILWFARRTRKRKRQIEKVAIRAQVRATKRLLVSTLAAWRHQAKQQKTIARSSRLQRSRAQRFQRSLLLHKVWYGWTTETRHRIDQRKALRRICKHRVRKTQLIAWQRWTASVKREQRMSAVQELHQQKTHLYSRTHRQELRRILRAWHQIAGSTRQQRRVLTQRENQRRVWSLKNCMMLWRLHYVPRMQFRRILLRVIMEAQRKTLLRSGLKKWKHQAVQLTAVLSQHHDSAHLAKVQAQAMNFLRRGWAVRDVRLTFVLWQKFWRISRKRKQVLNDLIERKSTALLRQAWGKLKWRIGAYVAFQRMGGICKQYLLRCAWCQLQNAVSHHKTRNCTVQRLLTVIGKALLRSSWIQWKRRDFAIATSRMIHSQAVSNTTMQAFMGRVSLRHFSRSLLLKVFGKWRTHVNYQQSLRRRVVQLLTKQDSFGVRRCFQSWATGVKRDRNARQRVFQIFARRCLVMARLAFMKWRVVAMDTAYQAKHLDSQRQLKAQREALARRVAMELFSSWQKPTLQAVVRGWKTLVDRKRRTIKELQVRRSSRKVKLVLTEWRKEVTRRKRIQSFLTLMLWRKQHHVIDLAWSVWTSRVMWLEAANRTVSRLLTSLRIRLLRSGWRSLQRNQDVEMRRQSMMVVISAQQQFHQQKELHRLRSIAFLLQRQQKGLLKERFMLWKAFALTRRERKAMLGAVVRRYSRRVTRSVLRAWREDIFRRREQALRIEKWQTTQCRNRRVRCAWSAWDSFAARRVQARELLRRLQGNREKSALIVAWQTWLGAVNEQKEAEKASEVAHWRRATTMQQNQVASLEARTELLILESAELKRLMGSQRQRCAEAFLRKTQSVVYGVWARRMKSCWAHWISMVDKINTARWLVEKAATLRERGAFVRWKQETQFRKWTQLEAQMLEKVACILSASTVVVLKKKTWHQWVMYIHHRRAKRNQQRVIDLLRRKQGDGTIMRLLFGGWKSFVRDQVHRRGVALMMETNSNHKLLRLVIGTWTKWREGERSKREAVLMLFRIDKAIQRRCVQHLWLKWKAYIAEAAIVLVRSRVLVMEAETLEHEENCLDQVALVRVFTAWRETTTQERLHREEFGAQQKRFDALRTKQLVIQVWRRVVDSGKLKEARTQRPMLCIRTNIKKRPTSNAHEGTEFLGAVLSFGKYKQHRQQLHWRVQLSRRVTQTRMRRFYGLVWLLRSLQRHHQRVQRRALWRWFARIQPISYALQAVSFNELPWRRVGVDYAGSMLLLTLEELDLARQTHQTELMQRAWCAVDAIVRSQQRQATRRAFEKWRWSRQKRPASARGALTTTRRVVNDWTANTERARARACIVQLVRVQLRRAFSKWKAQYMDVAIQQAQAEHDALHEALAQTAIRRLAIDPQIRA